MKTEDRPEILLMVIVAVGLLLAFASVGCGQKHSPQDGATTAPSQPAPTYTPPQSGQVYLCGDLIVWSSGFAFLVNTAASDVTGLIDGTYGHDAYATGLGGHVPACHYSIVNGVPNEVLN